jgi:CelD/BcsL family acetyltransferase involved in cellulose biosynthesis
MLAPAQNITIERRPLAGLADIVDPWRQLAQRAAEPNVFYTPDFALAAAPALGRDVETILAWSAERQLLGLLPFRRSSRRYGVRLPLIDRDATTDVVAAFIAHIVADASQLVLLPLLTDSGPVARALRAAAERRNGARRAFGQHQRAALDLAAGRPRDLDEVIGTKRMRESRRLRRRLGETGRVEFAMARAPATVAQALQRFLTLESQGWKGAAGTALIQSDTHRRLAEAALDALAGRGAAMVAELSLDGCEIASVILLRSGDRAWSWKIAYDEGMARFSPGLQAMTDLTAALLSDDTIRFADSCAVPDHPLMDHLWHDRLAMVDLMIAVRPRSRSPAAWSRCAAMPSLRHVK